MAENTTTIKVELDVAKAQADANALVKKIEQLTKDFGENSKEVQEAQKEYDSLNKNLKELEKSQEPLSGQLEKITKQLQVLKLNGQENTKEYANLIAEAGKLKDAMQDTEKAISLVASDTSNLDAILGATSAATGGFGLFTAGMSILGKDTETVEKSQKKLMQAIALVNSVQQISNALNKDSALMVKLNTIAHKLFAKQMQATAVATNGASGAMKGFKAALVSTGIGALVVALGFAVSKLVDFIERSKEAKEAAEEYSESVKNVSENVKSAYNTYVSTITSSQTALKDSKEALESFGETAEQQLERVNKKLEELRGSGEDTILEGQIERDKKRINELEQAYEDARIAYRNMVQTGNEEKIELAKFEFEQVGEDLAAWQKALGDDTKALDDLKISENNLLLQQKQLNKEIKDKAIAAAKEYANLIKEIGNNSEEAQRKIRDLLAQMVSDDPERYYRAVTENLKSSLDEQYAIEKDKHEKYLEKIKGDDAATEKENERYRNELLRITYEWQLNQQKADDDYNKYLDEKDEKDNQVRQEALEKTRQYYEDLAEAAKQTKESDKIANSPKDPLSVNRARYAEELAIIDKFHDDALFSEDQYLKAKELLEQKYHIKWKDLNGDEKDYYVQKMNEMASYAGNIFGAIADMQEEDSREGFEKSKQFQSAQAAISTMTGVIGAISSYSREPGGPLGTALGAAAAASILATGVAQIKKIQSTTFNNASSSLGSSNSEASTAHTSGRVSGVSQSIITKQISPVVQREATQYVLVVDDVTAKQQQQNRIQTQSKV